MKFQILVLKLLLTIWGVVVSHNNSPTTTMNYPKDSGNLYNEVHKFIEENK